MYVRTKFRRPDYIYVRLNCSNRFMLFQPTPRRKCARNRLRFLCQYSFCNQTAIFKTTNNFLQIWIFANPNFLLSRRKDCTKINSNSYQKTRICKKIVQNGINFSFLFVNFTQLGVSLCRRIPFINQTQARTHRGNIIRKQRMHYKSESMKRVLDPASIFAPDCFLLAQEDTPSSKLIYIYFFMNCRVKFKAAIIFTLLWQWNWSPTIFSFIFSTFFLLLKTNCIIFFVRKR